MREVLEQSWVIANPALLAIKCQTPEQMAARYLLDTNICIYIAKQNPPAVRARSTARSAAPWNGRASPIGNNGLWIAAHALAQGWVLVTNNEREFRRGSPCSPSAVTGTPVTSSWTPA